MKNILLCAYNWTGCKAVKILNKREDVNLFVYTHEKENDVPDVGTYCEENFIKYTTEKINIENIPFKPDYIISVYYRNIIPKEIISYVEGKIMNLHPSLLPRYRGCSSVTWALINGENEYGYTYHYIDEGIDTGNIIFQEKLDIEEWDTQLTLYNKVMFYSMDKFNIALDLLFSGIKGTTQSGGESYYKRGCPYGGNIDSKWSEEKIKRFIRAMYFPPYPKAKFKGNIINSYEEYIDLKNKI